ncbi:MAG: hypothetical protein KJ736_03105 [Candidatus Omnitrophica bacterium]|nr:hypothetical protein [Candidatus Omnitrophota bacterium]
MQKKLAENIILILLFLSVSFNITYWAIAKYDVNTDMSAVSDAEFYIKMSQYDYQNVPYRYANRFLMPSVVSLVSKCLNIENLLSRHY